MAATPEGASPRGGPSANHAADRGLRIQNGAAHPASQCEPVSIMLPGLKSASEELDEPKVGLHHTANP